MELGRQVAPLVQKYEAKQHGASSSVREDAEGNAQIQLQPDSAPSVGGSEEAKSVSDSEKRKEKSGLAAAPHAAKQVAVGTGKGLGRIVGAGLKAPMTFTHGLTRGFHNVPKLYGEEVREYENVVDLRSGLLVSAKVSILGRIDVGWIH